MKKGKKNKKEKSIHFIKRIVFSGLMWVKMRLFKGVLFFLNVHKKHVKKGKKNKKEKSNQFFFNIV